MGRPWRFDPLVNVHLIARYAYCCYLKYFIVLIAVKVVIESILIVFGAVVPVLIIVEAVVPVLVTRVVIQY